MQNCRPDPKVPTTVSGFTGRVSTIYEANLTTVTDQSNQASRRSMTNALGQQVRVDEPDGNGTLGNQATNYSYDLLGNLIKVEQGSQPARFFSYDALSRLIRARNPEQAVNSNLTLEDTVSGNNDWCTAYVYDNNGNLVSKTDPRGITTNYVYDSLNRVTSRSYSNDPNSTPTVTYTYDKPVHETPTEYNRIGRLTSVESSVAKTSYDQYDATGMVLGITQTIKGQSNRDYTVGYVHDLSGHTTQISYPSGHVVNYNYDSAGRLADKDANNLAFTGNLGYGGSVRPYSKGISYGPAGQMIQELFGTWAPIYNQAAYNSRGQLTEILAGTGTSGNSAFNRGKIVNDYSTTDNNGNLRQQTVYIPDTDNNNNPTSRNQQYGYDFLNRLTQVDEYTGDTSRDWHQKFNYDRWGNRTIDAGVTSAGIPHPQFSVNTATNQLGVLNGTGQMQYDAAGNLEIDTFSSATYSGLAEKRFYDAENRMTKEKQANEYIAGEYSFDGDGHRVKRVVNGVETWQIYGAGGELLAEYAANSNQANPQKEYGYRHGQLLITADAPAAVSLVPVGVMTRPETTTSANSNVKAGVRPSILRF